MLIICASFAKNFVAKNFKKSPNQVTLLETLKNSAHKSPRP